MGWGKKIGTAWRDLRRDPAAFVRYLAGRMDHLVVFSADVEKMPPLEHRPEIEVRRLTDAEVAYLPECGEELRRENGDRFQTAGFNGAWGLFYKQRFAHISWIIFASQESQVAPRLLGMKRGEAEITACYTLEEFRGLGLYPYMIRYLAERLREDGINRIYMKTTPVNFDSQRGIQKAGLKKRGHVWRYWLPWIKGEGVTFRGHRLA